MNKALLLLLVVGLVFVAAEDDDEKDSDVFYKAFHGNDFNELDGWTVVNSHKGGDVFGKCGSIKLVGGHGVFGRTTLLVKNFKLPPHHSIGVKVQFWKIDSWDNEIFYFWVDDKVVFQKNYQVADGQQICGQGSNWNEYRENIDIKFAHSNPTANFVMTASINEAANNESWAIRDFTLTVFRCPQACDTCRYGQSEEECAAWELHKWSWTKLSSVSSEGWGVTSAQDRSSECGGIQVYGGFNVFGRAAAVDRKFDLPPHFRIKVKLTFLKIDSWDNEEAYITLDGMKIWSRKLHYNEGYFTKLCGATSYKTLFIGVEADGSHQESSVTVRVSSTINEAANNESWGVRDFFIYYQKCAKECGQCSGPTESDCTKCGENWAVENGKCVPLVNFILMEQSFMEKKFTGIKDWSLMKNKGGRSTSVCAGYTLVGGFDVFGAGARASKIFTIPDHSRIRLIVQIYKIDSWDNEWMFIDVDGVRMWQRQLGFANGGRPLCGQGHANWNELIMDVDEIFHHNDRKLTLVLGATINQDAADESWGFREFRLFYEAKQECAIFYTECNYKGAAFEFCGESDNFRQDGVPPNIRSIKIPPQGRVTLFQNTEFGGKKVTYKKSVECIKDYQFSMAQMSMKIENENNWVDVETGENLRKTL